MAMIENDDRTPPPRAFSGRPGLQAAPDPLGRTLRERPAGGTVAQRLRHMEAPDGGNDPGMSRRSA